MKTIRKLFCIMMALSLLMSLSVPVMAKTKKPSKTNIVSVNSDTYGYGSVTYETTSGAKGYQVQFATNTKFTKNKKTVTTSDTTAYKSGLKAGCKYYVRVRAYNKNGKKKQYGPWSKIKSFTVKDINKPGTPNISSVYSDGYGAGTVVFNQTENTTKYEVQFAQNSKFTKGVKKATTTFASLTKSGLSANKKYYVRVRAFNQSKAGKWSAVKSFTVSSKQSIKLTRDQWLKTVDDWCNYMIADNNWIYSNSNNRKNVDKAIKESHTTNCALMIMHALQRAGILSKGEAFYSDEKGNPVGKDAWNKICRYATIIDGGKKLATQLDLQPGDIVMWDGHMNVYIGKDDQNNLVWYDASSLVTVDKKHGSLFKNFTRVSNDLPIPKTGKPHIAYKIIRLNYKK